MPTIAELKAIITADTRPLEAGLERAERGLRGLDHSARTIGKGLGGLFADLGRGLTTGLGVAAGIATMQAFGAAVHAVSDATFGFNARIEQTRVAFETLLGSAGAADRLLGELQEFAARTPFEFPELAQSVRLLKSFGFETGALLPTLQAVGDAVSALGGGAFEVDRVIRALGQTMAKGRLQTQEMLQVAEVGIPVYEILAEKLGVTTAELQKMVERGAVPARDAIDALVEGMGERFAGAMEAQSRTFTGLMSTLRDQINLTLGRIMEPAFEVAKGQLEDLVRLMDSPEFADWAEEMSRGAEDLARDIASFLEEQGPDLLRLAGDLAKAGLNLAEAVADLAVELNRLNEAMGGKGIELLLGLVAAQKLTGGIPGHVAGGVATGLSAALAGRLLGAGAGAAAAAGGGLSLGALGAVGAAATLPFLVLAAGKQALGELPSARGFEGRDLFGLLGKQAETIRQHVPAIDEVTQAWQRWRLVQENTVNVIQQATAEQRLQIEYFADLQRATQAVADAQLALAGAYQEGLDAQKVFGEQQSEYRGQLSAVEDALEIVRRKQAEGIPLTQQEAALLANEAEITGRLSGAIEDATLQKGLLAAANAELMLAQDELNRLQERGITAGEEYEAAQQRVAAAQAKVKELTGESGTVADLMRSTMEDLSSVLQNELVPALEDLNSNLALLPKDPVAIQIQLATEEAERQLEELRRQIRQGALLPVSISGPGAGGIGAGAGKFQHGGRVPHDMVALVGEAGPELVVLPGGAEVIPADTTRQLLSQLSDTVSQALPPLSDEQAEALKRAADAYSAALQVLADAVELAAAIPDADLAVPQELFSQLAALARHAVDAMQAVDPALSEEAAGQLRRFAEASSDALRPIADALRLAGELAEAVPVDPERLSAAVGQASTLLAEVSAALATPASQLMPGQAEQISQFASAASDAVRAEAEALRLVSDLVQLPAFDPAKVGERASLLAQTIELVASDLSAATDRLIQDQPEILERLTAFNETIGPALGGLQGVIESIGGLREMGRLSARVAERFEGNMQVVADAVHRSADEFRALEESGVLELFGRVADRLATALAAVEGIDLGDIDAVRQAAREAGRAVAQAQPGGNQPVHATINIVLDGQVLKSVVTDILRGEMRTVR